MIANHTDCIHEQAIVLSMRRLDELPSYEDSNNAPVLALKVNEPHRTYIPGDVLSGNIELMLTQKLNEVLAEGQYHCSYVVLQLQCAFISQRRTLRQGDTIYYCRGIRLLEISGPFANHELTCEARSIPFEVALDPRMRQLPPSISLAGSGDFKGGIRWSLSAWIEGASQNDEIDTIHWTKQVMEVNVYTLLLGAPKQNPIESSVNHLWTTNLYKLEVRGFPHSMPQGSETFGFQYSLYRTSDFFLHTVEFILTTILVIDLGENCYEFTVRCSLHLATHNAAAPERFSQVVTNCPCSTRAWPQSFALKGTRLQHMLSIFVHVDALPGRYRHEFPVTVVPPQYVLAEFDETSKRQQKEAAEGENGPLK